ncbi:unnamed protein product [Eruca vesicaria subsp. sativa]|uniref:Uncharacterized protein n=1 Tax=Eruca vesicaria subsp. sativa TaxID=29727 RepID=A0ABC8IZ54_ERUVS|nr:unnamed protein product [Eruca vesicaria subsp. sativa]
MEDLHGLALRYMNVPDPTEAAARRQRVLLGDAQGQTEEAADRLLADAAAKLQTLHYQTQEPQIAMGNNLLHEEFQAITERRDNSPNSILPLNNNESSPHQEAEQPLRRMGRRRTKPARLRSVVVSPITLHGTSSRKRNVAMIQRSPAPQT